MPCDRGKEKVLEVQGGVCVPLGGNRKMPRILLGRREGTGMAGGREKGRTVFKEELREFKGQLRKVHLGRQR